METTTGVKQGCVLSPILFNLFINKLPEVFDDTCDPVLLNEEKLSILMWADDVLVPSLSAKGLQQAINKTYKFFSELDLSVNSKKTKVMIFNLRGLTLGDHPDHFFMCGNNRLEVASDYTYLGLKVKPSGTFSMAIEELYKKASRAWFAISNIIYKHKKLHIRRAFKIFDSLVAQVALYGCELWTPYSLKGGSENTSIDLLANGEGFSPERLNQ